MDISERSIANVKSVLQQWEHKNEQKVSDYVRDHKWLKADIKKLNDFKRQNNLIKLAITSTDIYGLGPRGGFHATGRANLGIGDNFS